MRGFALLKAALLLSCTRAAYAAVHTYNDDYFYAVADAYIFRGGREGLYASTREVQLAAASLSYAHTVASSRTTVSM